MEATHLVEKKKLIRKKDEWQQLDFKLFIGIDIGADFHMAVCLPFDKVGEWNRQKTVKIDSTGKGISEFFTFLQDMQKTIRCRPSQCMVIHEPTGGHYGFLLIQSLINAGYPVFEANHKTVKDFREGQLGLSEKSDTIDAKVMAILGYHKLQFPEMKGVRIGNSPLLIQMLFRTLTRDRWLLTTQLTRRKNQIQQLFRVTNPELNSVFTNSCSPSVLKLVLKYPTAEDMAKASEKEIRFALGGGRGISNKTIQTLLGLLPKSIIFNNPYLIQRQKWLIEDATRIQCVINDIDNQMKTMIYGDECSGILPHPYTAILKSFPVMSDQMVFTLIGVIGDVKRFSNDNQFKKYLGVSAENKMSGTSVTKSRQTNQGSRDTRRILFLMAIILISPKQKENVFRIYYQRLIEKNKKTKRNAIGHLCGKIASVLYFCLKNNLPYDPKIHADKCGLKWNDIIALKN